jgi:dimethylargininase
MNRDDGRCTALVGEVSGRLGDAELTFLDRRRIDVSLAREQHSGYRDLLARLGADVVVVPTDPDRPDGVFVEDTVVVVGDTAILTRSGAPSRRGEVDIVRPIVEAYCSTVVCIEPPATLDGGDVLQVGHTVYVGISTRTDAAGVEQLSRQLAPWGREVVPVRVDGALHLKTAATALPDGTIVVEPRWGDVAAFGDREIIDVPEPAGANLLLLGDGVVVSASAPRTAGLLEGRGLKVHMVELSEFEKAEAGPTCLSVLMTGTTS